MKDGRIAKLGAIVELGTVAAVGARYVQRARKPPAAISWYVALGSSYAAGLGLGPKSPDSPIVSQRSIDGYPPQLARLLKVPSLTDMTSS